LRIQLQADTCKDSQWFCFGCIFGSRRSKWQDFSVSPDFRETSTRFPASTYRCWSLHSRV
jgi:hypothetical protein